MTEKLETPEQSPASRKFPPDSILNIDNLNVHFFTRRGEVKAIRGINLDVRRGEVVGIVGESGCGKSVTSLSIVDLLPSRTGAITEGDIYFENENISDIYRKRFEIRRTGRKGKVIEKMGESRRVEKDIQKIRGRISMIFQDPLTSLDPLYKVQTQMLESILYNNKKTIIRRVLDKSELKSNRSELMDTLPGKSVDEFVDKIINEFGKEGFYQELLFISNMNLSESDKKLRIMRSISQTAKLSDQQVSSLKKKLEETGKSIVKPRDRKNMHLSTIRDPVTKEAVLYSLELLEFIDMPSPERVLNSYPHELSGGMKQRVMIGLAVGNNPDLLIADEPTTALDVTTQHQILYLLKSLNKRLGLTIIFITHDLGVMATMADRIAVMYSGKICEVGPSSHFFTDPLHPYTKGLLRSVPVEGMQSKKLFTIPGQVPDLLDPPQGCPFADRCDEVMDICRNNPPPLEEVRGRDVYCWLYGGEPGEQ